jgi:hypothetical protein
MPEQMQPARQTAALQACVAAHAAQLAAELTAELRVMSTEELVADMCRRGMDPPAAGAPQASMRAAAIAWLAECAARARPARPAACEDPERVAKRPREEPGSRPIATGTSPARGGMVGPAPPQDGVGVLLSEFLAGQTASAAPPAAASACFSAEELAWMRIKCQGASALVCQPFLFPMLWVLGMHRCRACRAAWWARPRTARCMPCPARSLMPSSWYLAGAHQAWLRCVT